MNQISADNYELWLLRYAEGDLAPEERRAVEEWLASYPEAAEELALYQEAPRLERDERVRYAAQPSQPLWPVVARWSAAAAVIVALMLPALRMGGLARLPQPAEEPALMAAAMVAEEGGAGYSRNSRISKVSKISRISSYPSYSGLSGFSAADSVFSEGGGAVPEAPVAAPAEVIPSTSLIAFDDSGVEDTLASFSLIAFEPADWGDRLLAANDGARESLAQSAGGRLVSRLLPDSDQLAEHVVDPLRERLSIMRNKLKQ